MTKEIFDVLRNNKAIASVVVTFLLSIGASFFSYANAVEAIKVKISSLEDKQSTAIEYTNTQLQDIRHQLSVIHVHLMRGGR